MKKVLYPIIIIIFLSSGCENTTEINNPFEYSMEQKMDCFCPQAGSWIKLYVQSDTIAKAIRISDNIQLNYTQYRPYKSIRQLWDLISKIDTTKYELKVEIDSVNNFPSYIYSNRKNIVHGDTVLVIADADYSYTTRNYKRIK